MQPVVAVAEGIHPLIEQQKFSEAEAQVDRALKFLGESQTPEARPGARSNADQGAASAAGAKVLPCPGAGAAIDLASGDWALRSDCTAVGLNLRGDVQLWVENLALTVDGNIQLDQNAGLQNSRRFVYHCQPRCVRASHRRQR